MLRHGWRTREWRWSPSGQAAIPEGGLRWTFVSLDRTLYSGPPYAGEDSLEKIRVLVGVWWAQQRAPGRDVG